MSKESLARAKARANEVKDRRRAIRSLCRKGEPAHCYLTEPELATAYVREVLIWQKGWGARHVGAALGAIGAYNPRCNQLTEEQRAILSYYCTWPGRDPAPLPPNARQRHPSDL